MFIIIYLQDKVYLIDYLKKMIKNKKVKIKRIFINYSYFKKCIRRVYKEIDKE